MCRMITKLKPYPAYKDSGVEWLGQVPEHWDVRRLGSLLQERRETNEGLRVTEVLSVLRERGVIPYAEKGNIGNKKSDDISRYKVVRPNDIVVNSMNVIIGSVGLSKFTGCISPVYYILTRRDAQDDPGYLNAYFQTKPFQQSLIRLGNGILAHRMRIPMELLKCEPFPRPPADEQTAIVRFLDYMDRRIRRYIRAKQKLIKLLEEYKQALIHQAVTGSIDVRTGKPYPAYKDSGVEWLGEVPEHWQVRKLKYVVSFTGGGTPSKTVAVYWEGDVPWVSPKDMTRPVLHDTTDHISWDAIEVSATSLVPAGTLLIVVRSGILRRKIPAAINAVPMALNQDMKALRPKERLAETTFLLAFIQGCEVTLLTEWTKHGATVESIEYELLANSRIPLPPLPEQNTIVEYLDTQTTKIDAAIAATRSEIELLREYRTRLIADVVTGKVDVREVAVQLPEEPPEEEAESMDADEIAGDEATDEEAGTETVEEEEVEP